MGAKKKKGTVAHCPESLRTPITITFDQLVAKMLIDHGKQDYELSDDLKAAWIELNRDIQQRICDAATSCGFSVGAMPLLLQLLQLDPRPMLELFACKFPRAFRLQLDGTKKMPRKNGGRGVQNKMQLMESIDQLKRGGLNVKEACERHACSREIRLGGGTVETAYYEAKRWLANKGGWTSSERLEVMEYCYKRGMFE
jgi:hypothetical protein